MLRKLFCVGFALTVACGGDDRPPLDAAVDGALPDAFSDATPDSAPDDAAMDVSPDVPVVMMDSGADSAIDTGVDAALDAGADVAPGCADGVQNGDETDVDCGGTTCFDRCGDGFGCMISSDCSSGVCIGFTCQPARCSDGIRNGMETGIDCGGPDCGGCGLGEACTEPTDCADGECSGGFCVAAHCFDMVRNVNETDVDCGGPDCGPCSAGLGCRADTDCMMGTCVGGYCRTAACTNGALDPGEVDIDCGGECPGCPDGTVCTMNDDCLSGRCDGTVCTSCSDGMLNGGETDTDCGGATSCRRCFGGEACTAGTDCTSGVCTTGVCEGGGLYYEEDFSGGDGGWTVGGSNSSWEYAAPTNTKISAAYTGTEVWVTNAMGDYNSSEDSWVESPSFDLSGAMRDPLIEFAVIYDLERSSFSGTPFDVVWLEVSTDGGTTWTDVGAEGDATNWYIGSNFSGQDGWGGDSMGWLVASHELTGTAGFADVRVRIHLDSDFSGQLEGFAFDDVVVREDICNNGILDASETDVDCGGTICGPCSDGLTCVMPSDCGSGICDAGTCISCVDGIQNGDELAIDCGGPTCGLCPGGTACTDGTLCASGECVARMCTTPPVFYEEDFEGGDGGWVTAALSTSTGASSWEYGMPAGTVIDSAASGANAWVTNLTGNYNNSEQSYIESPPIDLSAASDDPVLSLSLNYVTENNYDEGWIEMSIDGGTTWTKVLGSPGAQNWYNDTANQWWEDTSGGWVTASTVLTGSARQSDVRLRVRFSSDSSSTREGFGIDDVRIAPPAPDLAVEVVSSGTRCQAGVVRVTNVGSAPVSFFDLTTVADGTMNTSRVTTALEPGETFEAEVIAAMTLEASVVAAGDSDMSNDMASAMIPAPISLGSRYLETFEMGPGGWVASGTNSSWEHGEPTDTFIGVADSGMNAWVTDLSADYNDDEMSYLTSPCFDMSATMADVNLSFSRIFDLEPTNDHVHVEYSVDGGVTWAKLGAFGDGVNWYNDVLGNFWDGVSGATDEWRRASIDVPGSAGAGLVRFRFVMESNGSINEDGFGVDDVIIMP